MRNNHSSHPENPKIGVIGVQTILAAMLLAVVGAVSCVYAQKAVPKKAEFPYSVDLLQYTGHNPAGGFVQGNYGANGATGIDVFGWSSTGNVAYMIDGGCEGFRGGFCYNIVVSSMVTDRVLFTLRIDSEDYDEEKTFEQIYALKKKEIAAALEKHEIVERKADFLKFPLKTGDAEYKCHINQIKKNGDDKITNYNVVIVKNGKETKKISSVSKSYADTVLVLGYFLNPFEPTRMLVVTATNTQFEGNNFGLSFNGCDLTKGFNEKLAKEVSKAKETASYFTDARDGKKYRAVQIGSKKWMAENLNYQTGNSWCYDNNESNCKKYGRLYDLNTAKKACPAGWHLPPREEWDYLAQVLGGKPDSSGNSVAYNGVGLALMAKSVWGKAGTDAYGFSALPGGRLFGKSFDNARDGYWWTATESNDGCNYYRSMSGADWLYEGCYSDGVGFSVRCVED